MIPIKDVYTLIEQQPDLKFIRVIDLSSNKILDIESNSNKDAVQQLKEKEDILKPYGKVYIKAATQSQKNQNWKFCCTWSVLYSNATPATTGAAVTPTDPWSQMVQMMTAMKMMKEMNGDQNTGYVHPEVVTAKIALQKATGELELEKLKLQMQNDDPIKKYGSLAPMVMSMLGKKPEEIQSMINLSASMHNSLNGQGANKIAGPNLVTNVQGNFSELQNVSEEEKNKRITAGLEKLAWQISAEDMVILVESLNANPDYATQAVLMMKQAAAAKSETKPS